MNNERERNHNDLMKREFCYIDRVRMRAKEREIESQSGGNETHERGKQQLKRCGETVCI